MMMQAHRSDPRILGGRTLARDHQCLAGLLRAGLSVLDVGCGTGSITAGIAEAVGPNGRVVGVDRDESLLKIARAGHAGPPNLRFETGDAAGLAFDAEFDIVTSARTLQWVSDPLSALTSMRRAAKPGGAVVVLDYDHTANSWMPDPPEAFRRFYQAFLSWRAANGWDNAIAQRLPGLFGAAGLADVASDVQDETIERGDPEFAEKSRIWLETIEVLGSATGSAYKEAREEYARWIETGLIRQTLSLRAVTGRALLSSGLAAGSLRSTLTNRYRRAGDCDPDKCQSRQ